MWCRHGPAGLASILHPRALSQKVFPFPSKVCGLLNDSLWPHEGLGQGSLLVTGKGSVWHRYLQERASLQVQTCTVSKQYNSTKSSRTRNGESAREPRIQREGAVEGRVAGAFQWVEPGSGSTVSASTQRLTWGSLRSSASQFIPEA